jgi:hypothetical protein
VKKKSKEEFQKNEQEKAEIAEKAEKAEKEKSVDPKPTPKKDESKSPLKEPEKPVVLQNHCEAVDLTKPSEIQKPEDLSEKPQPSGLSALDFPSTVKQIKSIKMINEEIWAFVEWNPGKDGKNYKDQYVPVKELKKTNIDMVCDFYEMKIKIKTSKD